MSSSSPRPTRKLRAIAAGAGAAFALMLNSVGGFAIAQTAQRAPDQTAPEAPPEVGLWYDDTGRGAVRISQCGGQLCGHIHWLQAPLNSEGKPLHDKNNPDPAARQRPICGMQVFGELVPQGDGSWDGGWIYDPKVGKSYSVQIRQAGAEVLEVHGYAGVKLFGKTFVWRKAPDDLPPCDNTQANSGQPAQQFNSAAGKRF